MIIGGLAAIAGVLPLHGCYYMQAISGHTQLMSQRRPMTEVLADPDASEALKERLRLVQDARRFSIEELKLPDNDSYRSYADLGRDYVVWNVFAAPEFSLQPKEWCYIVAGCVAYRGYFHREDAVEEAEELREDGFDVAMGGVSAYSTLGKFADPVLNTMMQWSNADLVATLFHELAHQELYVKGDTQFNESFASAVSDIGLERWFSRRGKLDALEEYRDTNALRHELLQLVEAAKADLGDLYASNLDDDEKRRQKRARLDALSADAATLFAAAGLDTNPLPAPLNNARLASLGLYEGWVPAFRAMYVECGERITCLYDRAREVAALPVDERTARLELLSAAQEAPERVADSS
ncbi:MAG TPA: aminopeptidase [Woeseiaceae bacterium]|nr:aminopeptidase [Woeseiaceae bacterium]